MKDPIIILKLYVEGAGRIEPPPVFTDRDIGFEVRVAPSTIALNQAVCFEITREEEKGCILIFFRRNIDFSVLP